MSEIIVNWYLFYFVWHLEVWVWTFVKGFSYWCALGFLSAFMISCAFCSSYLLMKVCNLVYILSWCWGSIFDLDLQVLFLIYWLLFSMNCLRGSLMRFYHLGFKSSMTLLCSFFLLLLNLRIDESRLSGMNSFIWIDVFDVLFKNPRPFDEFLLSFLASFDLLIFDFNLDFVFFSLIFIHLKDVR